MLELLPFCLVIKKIYNYEMVREPQLDSKKFFIAFLNNPFFIHMSEIIFDMT